MSLGTKELLYLRVANFISNGTAKTYVANIEFVKTLIFFRNIAAPSLTVIFSPLNADFLLQKQGGAKSTTNLKIVSFTRWQVLSLGFEWPHHLMVSPSLNLHS